MPFNALLTGPTEQSKLVVSLRSKPRVDRIVKHEFQQCNFQEISNIAFIG